MSYRLRIKDDDGKSSTVSIAAADALTVGRDEGNMIRLPQANVSRRHARLVKRDDGVYLEDLSRYGTRINGARVKDSTRLGTGDIVTIGDYELSLLRREKTGERGLMEARVAEQARDKRPQPTEKPRTTNTSLRKKPKAVRSGDTTIIRVDDLLREESDTPTEERGRSLLWLVLLALLLAGGALAAWFLGANGDAALPRVQSPPTATASPEPVAEPDPSPEEPPEPTKPAPEALAEPTKPARAATTPTPTPEEAPETKPAAASKPAKPAAAAPAPVQKPATPPVVAVGPKPAEAPPKPTVTKPPTRPTKIRRGTRVKPPKATKVPPKPVVKPPTGRELYKEARRLMHSNKAEALKKFQAAAGKGYAKAHKLMGMMYLQSGETAKAKKAFKRYLKLRPGASDAPQVQDTIDRLGG